MVRDIRDAAIEVYKEMCAEENGEEPPLNGEPEPDPDAWANNPPHQDTPQTPNVEKTEEVEASHRANNELFKSLLLGGASTLTLAAGSAAIIEPGSDLFPQSNHTLRHEESLEETESILDQDQFELAFNPITDPRQSDDGPVIVSAAYEVEAAREQIVSEWLETALPIGRPQQVDAFDASIGLQPLPRVYQPDPLPPLRYREIFNTIDASDLPPGQVSFKEVLNESPPHPFRILTVELDADDEEFPILEEAITTDVSVLEDSTEMSTLRATTPIVSRNPDPTPTPITPRKPVCRFSPVLGRVYCDLDIQLFKSSMPQEIGAYLWTNFLNDSVRENSIMTEYRFLRNSLIHRAHAGIGISSQLQGPVNRLRHLASVTDYEYALASLVALECKIKLKAKKEEFERPQCNPRDRPGHFATRRGIPTTRHIKDMCPHYRTPTTIALIKESGRQLIHEYSLALHAKGSFGRRMIR